jgi:hypothetical protein
MTVRFLEFLSRNHHWKQEFNHNHLRISRVIQSLRILHSWELADWFYSKVRKLAGDSFSSVWRQLLWVQLAAFDKRDFLAHRNH